MKKILIPVDFSETSKNAARYGVKLAASVPGTSVILYNMYKKIIPGSDGTPLSDADLSRQIILKNAMNNLKNDLEVISDVPIDYVAEEGGTLVDNVVKYVKNQGIDWIVMGITGSTRLEQVLFGSNALEMVHSGVCPVIIVPPKAEFEKIENILLASDFKNVEATTPVAQIKKLLDFFKPKFHIVNIDHEHYVELTDEYKAERAKLEEMFKDYNPEFSFIRLFDFLEAISIFSEDKNIDLIITVPRSHNFLTRLFRTSNTKSLAYHSHIPLAAILS